MKGLDPQSKDAVFIAHRVVRREIEELRIQRIESYHIFNSEFNKSISSGKI
jgi:hypothetical protein